MNYKINSGHILLSQMRPTSAKSVQLYSVVFGGRNSHHLYIIHSQRNSFTLEWKKEEQNEKFNERDPNTLFLSKCIAIQCQCLVHLADLSASQ